MSPQDKKQLSVLLQAQTKLTANPYVTQENIDAIRSAIQNILARQKSQAPAREEAPKPRANVKVDDAGRYRVRVTSNGQKLTQKQASDIKNKRGKSPRWYLKGRLVGWVRINRISGTQPFDEVIYLYPGFYTLGAGRLRINFEVEPLADEETPYRPLTKAEREAPAPFEWDKNTPPNWLELNGAAMDMRRFLNDNGYWVGRINSKIGDLKKLGFYDVLTNERGSTFLLDFIISNQGRNAEGFTDKQQQFYADADALLFKWWRTRLDDDQRELFARRYANVAGQERVIIDLRKDTHYDYKLKTPSGMVKKLKRLGWKLHDYQKAAVNFATKHSDGQVVWGMEMGLGKTLSAIAAYHVLKDQNRVDQMIVTAPMSALNSWRNELGGTSDARFEIMERYVIAKREAVYKAFRNKQLDVIVMTPETMRNDALKVKSAMRSPLRTLRVADEVHFYKNPESARTRAFVQTLGGNVPGPVIGMTGTILPNKAQDFFFAVDAIAPTVLGADIETFAQRYAFMRRGYGGERVVAGFRPGALDRLYQNSAGVLFVRRISDPDVKIHLPSRIDLSPDVPTDEHQRLVQQHMGTIMVLRQRELKRSRAATSASVFDALWPRLSKGEQAQIEAIARKINVRNTTAEDKLHLAYAEWDSRRAKRELTELGQKYKGLMLRLTEPPAAVSAPSTALIRLRQASISPAVIPKVDEVLGSKYESPKIGDVAHAATTHMLNNPDSAVVIFTTYVKALERMALALMRRDVPLKRIALVTSPQNKKKLPVAMAGQVFPRSVLETMLQEERSIDYVISITRMLETGANLQKRAAFVAYLDTPYVPGQITQSTARVYRQGQKKTVTVYRPTSMAIEEVIERAIQTKLKAAANATGKMSDADRYLAEAILQKHGDSKEGVDIKDPKVLAKLLGVDVDAIKSGRDISLDAEDEEIL